MVTLYKSKSYIQIKQEISDYLSKINLKINRVSLWKAAYDIQDENRNTILKIGGPCCICDGACCPCDNEFKVIKKLFEKTIEFEI